jgi:hypothetical protein
LLRDQKSTTHNSCMVPPRTKEEMLRLFVDHLSDVDWDYIKSDGKKLQATTHDYYSDDRVKEMWNTSAVFADLVKGYTKTWKPGHLLPLSDGEKKIKVADGWGGYIEKTVGADLDSLAADLVKLQKEYI